MILNDWSTITGNTATVDGGGISSIGGFGCPTVTLNDRSTITGNTLGGIDSDFATVTLNGMCTVTGNDPYNIVNFPC